MQSRTRVCTHKRAGNVGRGDSGRGLGIAECPLMTQRTLGRSDVLLPFWARWPMMAQSQFRTIQVCLKDLLAPLRQVVAEVD
jgi:hypothetical protein